jgi:hypothetical protein
MLDLKKLKSITFVDLYLDGQVDFDEIDDYVDYWHDNNEDDVDLHKFLGLTKEDYKLWVEDHYSLKHVLDERKRDL